MKVGQGAGEDGRKDKSESEVWPAALPPAVQTRVLAPVSREAGPRGPPAAPTAHRIGEQQGLASRREAGFLWRWGPTAGQRVTGHPPAPSLWPQDGPPPLERLFSSPTGREQSLTLAAPCTSDPSLGGLGAGGSGGEARCSVPGWGAHSPSWGPLSSSPAGLQAPRQLWVRRAGRPLELWFSRDLSSVPPKA